MTQATKKIAPEKEKADKIAEKFEEKFAEDPLRFKALPGITTNWGPQRMVMLYQFVADPDGVQQEFADALGIDRSGVSRKANSMDWPKFEAELERLITMSPEEGIKHEALVHKTKATEKAVVKDRVKLVSREAFFDTLLKEAFLANQTVKVKPFVPTVLIKTPKNNRTAENVVLLLSDLHVGQEFDLEETGGINQYNMDVFYERAENLQKAVVEIIDIHSEAYKLPELHIFGLGDMVQGGNMNGEWGASSNSHTNVMKQAVIAGKTIAHMTLTRLPLPASSETTAAAARPRTATRLARTGTM